MAKVAAYHFNGLPTLHARSPDNASRRMFGPKCHIEPMGENMWQVYEENGYYGRNLLGYMVRE